MFDLVIKNPGIEPKAAGYVTDKLVFICVFDLSDLAYDIDGLNILHLNLSVIHQAV